MRVYTKKQPKKNSNFDGIVEKSALLYKAARFNAGLDFFLSAFEKFMTAWHEELIRVVGLLDDDFRVGSRPAVSHERCLMDFEAYWLACVANRLSDKAASRNLI